ncbi:hypothetical protein [Dyadobacter sediminis]|uniref:Porin family protein n=1 Tax=Dyadobacter sediminis TaxID=1493691 RepID=A0A5R9KA75_9BACT|nr:hypothetical protein [Dyadobacter sediminis]TLU91733.1 hypothetical protein FEM55_13205 [Dyadobacter sediminis]GGC00724.1 hypothetical protein GCM10011325_29930 [Dyadobacter sediminis]
MKKIFIFTLMLLFCTAGYIHAQFAGRKFISGAASVNFFNHNPDLTTSTNGYNYNINIHAGKFKSETRASGWNLSHSLIGGKSYMPNSEVMKTYKGINNLGFGIGRFWQYYKHFNNKLGVFAGPNIDLGYTFTKGPSPEYNTPNTTRGHTIALSAGLSAGMYYQLSEKWWITASLGFSNPVFVSYSAFESTQLRTDETILRNGFNYKLTPAISFPFVGLGFRYFLKE